MVRFFVSAFLVILLFNCSSCKMSENHGSVLPAISVAGNPSSETSQPDLMITLLDIEMFLDNPDKLALVQLINQNAKALNEGNEKKYLDTFTPKGNSKDLAKSLFHYYVNERKLRVAKLREPQFIVPNPDSPNKIQVTCVMEFYPMDSKDEKYQTNTYYFEKFDNWELMYID